MKICTKCGARMSDSNRFCEKCGSTLVTETAAGHTAVPVRSETSLSQLVGWLQKYGRHIMRVAALLGGGGNVLSFREQAGKALLFRLSACGLSGPSVVSQSAAPPFWR